MLAYGLFVLLCTQLAPRMQFFFQDVGLGSGLYQQLTELGRDAHVWGWIFPAVIVVMVFWWRWAGERGFLSGDGVPAGFAWLCPGLGKILKDFRYSQFADLLALLIENDVPLQEAIVLAGETTNDLALQNSARAIADATSRGIDVTYGLSGYTGFPPFLHWLITRRQEQEGLVSALRAASDMYHRRAVAITEWIKVSFPVLAAVFIGGGATLLYTLSIFYPLTELLRRLADPML
jgi:type II secretory pathway component PulF